MRKRSPAMALSAVAVLLALGFALWHVAHPQRMTPDSMEYTRIAVTMRGASLSVALTEAALARCASLAADPVGGYAKAVPAYAAQAGVAERLPAIASARAGRYGAVPAEWMDPCTAYVLDHPVTDDPRYSRIFDSRPLYPALVAPLLTWWTPDVALVAVSATLAALAGLALYGLALALGWSPWAALLAEVLVFLLPIGAQGARPLTEGTTWLLGTLILLGSAWSTRHRAAGIGLSTVAAILLVLARYPTALFIGLGSLGLALLWLQKGSRSLRLTSPPTGRSCSPRSASWPCLAWPSPPPAPCRPPSPWPCPCSSPWEMCCPTPTWGKPGGYSRGAV